MHPDSNRRRRTTATAFAVVFSFVLAACLPPAPPAVPPTPPPTDPIRVVVYGDALTVEMRVLLAGRLAGTSSVLEHAGGGFAVCDVLPSITTDAANPNVDVAVLQFTGDTSTPCMSAATTDPARTAAYGADLADALDTLTADPGRTVIVLSSPVRWSASLGVDEPAQLAFNQALADIVTTWQTAHAGSTQATFIDAAAAVTTVGAYAWDLPCLPGETVTMGCRFIADTIAVRSPDGRGFCPIAPQLTCPPVYSPGARRYLDTFADQVLAAL